MANACSMGMNVFGMELYGMEWNWRKTVKDARCLEYKSVLIFF